MEIEKRVYEAAVVGDIRALHDLLELDVLVLDRLTLTCFNETPLHIASMRGHIEFVKLILAHTPQLASEFDIRKSSALHIASAKGRLEIVKLLLLVNPDMCMACDCDGRNPLHLAAIKGRVEVIEELIRVRPRASLGTTFNRENILHLCVKHNQLETLKFLFEIVEWDCELLNAKDSDGHTILHLAVADKQTEAIKFLLKMNKIDVNASDENGNTALDILGQSRRNINDLEIGDVLRDAGSFRSKDMPISNVTKIPNNVANNANSRVASYLGGNHSENQPSKDDWLSKKRDTIMVVASLIATMAFQAGTNPPGGVWQEDKIDQTHDYKAGEAVMAYDPSELYQRFINANTIAFISSLSTILLLISGLPFRRRLCMWGLMVIMWSAVTATAFTYGISIGFVSPDKESAAEIIGTGVLVWCGLMALLLLGNTIRLLRTWYKMMRKTRTSTTTTTSNTLYNNV